IQASLSYFAHGPNTEPAPTVDRLVYGEAGARYLAGKGPVTAALKLDDSVSLGPYEVMVGVYHGPPEFTLAPLSFKLPAADFLRLVKAKRARIRVGDEEQDVDEGLQSGLRGLYRLSA